MRRCRVQVDLNEYAPKAANLFTSKQAEAQQKTESKGLAFLDDASLEEGAVQTDSGLVYLEVTAANPHPPSLTLTLTLTPTPTLTLT